MTQDPWWLRRHELRHAPDPTWVDRCSTWLQRPHGQLGPAAWLVLLQPTHLDAALRLPDGTMQTGVELGWGAPPDGAPIDAVIEPSWAAPRGDATELALTVHASQGGDVAWCRSTYRVPGAQPPFGTPAAPEPPPESPEPDRRVRLTLDEGQVEEYGSVANVRHELHEDAGYAQQHGFPGVVVPGLLTAATIMHHAGAGASGEARFWFVRPLAAGTLLRLELAADGPGSTVCHACKATGEVVAAGRVEARPAP